MDILRRVKDSIVPQGGRCPSKVFQLILDRDQSERVISPNRAMLYLQSGFINPQDMDAAKLAASKLRANGVTTFALVVARSADAPGTSPQRFVQSRLDALQIVGGKIERVFVASPMQGVLALVSMIDAVSAAVLAMMHEPSRVDSSSVDDSTELMDEAGYEDPSLVASSSIGLGFGLSTLFILSIIGSFVVYKRRRGKQAAKRNELAADASVTGNEIILSTGTEFEVARASPAKTARRRNSTDALHGARRASGDGFSLSRQHQQLAVHVLDGDGDV